MPTHIIFDFDSTFVQLETLEELAKIALTQAPDRDERVRAIERITAAGMAGRIGFGDSLAQRLALFAPHRRHVEQLIQLATNSISPSFLAGQALIQQHAASIWVVSGGFGEIIRPVVAPFGIAPSHVLANEFIWDETGLASGCDRRLPLAHDAGKTIAVKGLGLDGRVVMVGDGATDRAVHEAGSADDFIAYVETADRPEVRSGATAIARNFSEVAALVWPNG